MPYQTHKRPGATKAPAKLQRSSGAAAKINTLFQHTQHKIGRFGLPTAVKGRRRRSAAEKRSDSAGLNPLLLYERPSTPRRPHYQRYNATCTNACCKVATSFVHAPHTHAVCMTHHRLHGTARMKKACHPIMPCHYVTLFFGTGVVVCLEILYQ